MENMETVITRRRSEREETPDFIPGYFARIDKGDLLTHAEEIDLSERAHQRLIEKNLRLVVSVAKKYRGRAVRQDGSQSRYPDGMRVCVLEEDSPGRFSGAIPSGMGGLTADCYLARFWRQVALTEGYALW